MEFVDILKQFDGGLELLRIGDQFHVYLPSWDTYASFSLKDIEKMDDSCILHLIPDFCVENWLNFMIEERLGLWEECPKNVLNRISQKVERYGLPVFSEACREEGLNDIAFETEELCSALKNKNLVTFKKCTPYMKLALEKRTNDGFVFNGVSLPKSILNALIKEGMKLDQNNQCEKLILENPYRDFSIFYSDVTKEAIISFAEYLDNEDLPVFTIKNDPSGLFYDEFYKHVYHAVIRDRVLCMNGYDQLSDEKYPDFKIQSKLYDDNMTMRFEVTGLPEDIVDLICVKIETLNSLEGIELSDFPEFQFYKNNKELPSGWWLEYTPNQDWMTQISYCFDKYTELVGFHLRHYPEIKEGIIEFLNNEKQTHFEIESS